MTLDWIVDWRKNIKDSKYEDNWRNLKMVYELEIVLHHC